MRIVGLDLSLTATGWWDGEGGGTIKVKPPSSEEGAVRRLALISRRVLDVCGVVQSEDDGSHVEMAALVVVEGYSFGSRNTHAHSLGELGGVTKLRLQWARIPFVVMPPSRVRKYATGKGNAGKQEALIAAAKVVEVGDDHQADAYHLWGMAADHYGLANAPNVPKVNRKALEGVAWPTFEEGRA